MDNMPANPVDEIFSWCGSVLGRCEPASDDTRGHPGQRASAIRLRAPGGDAYVKIHRDPAHWHSEVHAYEQWAPAFGGFAPRLLAVRDVEPLAVIISALPGRTFEGLRLDPIQERRAWMAAGERLAALHSLAAGAFFGPCLRDGAPATAPAIAPAADAETYLTASFAGWLERGERLNCLTTRERGIIQEALGLVPSFAGEPALPCHRDYCPANWLVDEAGRWTGVIDFEFSGWDARANEFARLPGWEWVTRPDLVEALFTGYGRSFSPREEQQHLAARALYALGAVVWGEENQYRIFAAEGRQALAHLEQRLA